MNKQRKVLITTTYNEMGIIIDTKVEEVAQPNLQPTCNQLATDTISRQMATDALRKMQTYKMFEGDDVILIDQAGAMTELMLLPSAQPEIIRCKDCKHWNTTWQNDYAPNYHYCPMIDSTRRNDFYCADAERKEENNESN